MDIKIELTEDQRKALEEFARRLANGIKIMVDAIKAIWDRFNKFCDELPMKINKYIMSMHPKKRYKFFKAMGIKNYIPFFRRDGVLHCRNNC